jgi:hypothetical protein
MLAEEVEATSVALAREHGWTWEQIGDALGMSRQSVHAKSQLSVDRAAARRVIDRGRTS